MSIKLPMEECAGTGAAEIIRHINSDTDTLTLIQTSFPGQDELIERALGESEPFRALCQDFRDCVAVHGHWEQLDAAKASPCSQEYADLVVELGREIQVWLKAIETGPSPIGERSR